MPQVSTQHTPIRLIIADDQELARGGLRSFFRGEAAFTVVAEAEDGDEALALCASYEPHVVLLDIRMPRMDGLTACQAIKESFPRIHVVIVTMHEDPDYLVRALKAGAAGYLLKDSSRAEFLQAVRKVARGETFMDSQVMVQAMRRLATGPGEESTSITPLTPREQEVLRLMVKGFTNTAIGSALTISIGTVKSHVANIIAKLGVTDRTQAAVRAIELHLV